MSEPQLMVGFILLFYECNMSKSQVCGRSRGHRYTPPLGFSFSLLQPITMQKHLTLMTPPPGLCSRLLNASHLHDNRPESSSRFIFRLSSVTQQPHQQLRTETGPGTMTQNHLKVAEGSAEVQVHLA